MPELPEMEAWRRQLDEPVRAFPIVKAGPAHVATLKTFDPPLSTLEGRRLAGAERRAKRLLFPTADGELVVLVHLMTAGRLRFLRAGERQRLQRLGRGAQVADETGVADGRDDLPVADRDRVDEVDGLDGRPAADDYPERLQESEA